MNLTEPQRARFWRKVRPASSSECWSMDVAHTSQNQPSMSFNGKRWLGSRMMFSLTKGKIPTGLQVLHTCDNNTCVNPSHLWLGTQKDNIRDCVMKCRKGTQKLNRDQILEIRRLGESGVRFNDIAKQFDITPAYASRVIRKLQPEYVP